MKRFQAIWSLLIATVFCSLFAISAFAQSVAPSPAPSVSPVPVVAPAPVPATDFFSQVLAFIQQWGGIPTILKVAGIITLIIASMKVSYLNTLIWSKLGSAQVYVAPVLGLIAGILGLGSGGAPITAASVFAYVSAGAGAVILHELLDSVKAIPGIGPLYVTVINLIEGALGGPSAQPPAQK